MRREQVLILETAKPSMHADVVGYEVVAAKCWGPRYETPRKAVMDGWRLLGPPVQQGETFDWWFGRTEPDE